MAQSISDVFARGVTPEEGSRRQARLVHPAGESQTPEEGSSTTRVIRSPGGRLGRRAAFRPAEDLALRQDVLQAFATGMVRDGEWVAAARALEALGEYGSAIDHLQPGEEGPSDETWEVGFLRRRVLRALGSSEELSRELKRAQDLVGAPIWAMLYCGLERADLGWTSGDDPLRVRRRVERALRSLETEKVGPFGGLWAMQLLCDVCLESGDTERAMEVLAEATQRPGLPVEIRNALQARRAVWLHVVGDHEEARAELEQLVSRGRLPGDLDDLLVSLCFEVGDWQRAFSVLRSTARDTSRLVSHAVPLAMLHHTTTDNPATGRDLLRQATQERDDWTLLRLRERLLEAAYEEQGRSLGTELIDVLNRRLEGPLSVDERVNTLTRLGRLYEEEAGLEEAAAEVYREALSYDPHHVPALRALGRLYTRRENWRGLAELYEREISTLHRRPGSWRRHFQLGELYEWHLELDERALENYLIVLEERPNYLPALKASARILGRLERWTRLADLFLQMVETAPSRRQKLYLLDKVAEVAEQRLENYEVAIGAWREILSLDPENPRVYSALGRLYSRTGRWEDLLALNEEETALIDDPEEVASVLLRNAEIAEQELDDPDRAERFYRRCLDILPDYLPALESLGRIYLRGGRWTEIASMTGQELRSLDDPAKAVRQLGALAEILETHLDRRQEAIAIYEELWEMNPGDGHIFAALTRLYRRSGDSRALARVLTKRLESNPAAAEFAELQGELGLLAEWYRSQPGEAFGYYLAALQCEPANLHWLGGVARTWTAAGADATEVAGQLEDLLMCATEEEVRDRYFAIIARLRERAEGGPEASRAYRAHGAVDSLENQIVLRMAMAAAGERAELTSSRRALPHHPLQASLTLDRNDRSEEAAQTLSQERAYLSEAARRFLAGELPPEVVGELLEGESLATDLMAILDGDDLAAQDDEEFAGELRMRLRGLQARRAGDHQGYLRWTLAEAEVAAPSRRAARLLELARYAALHELPEEDTLFEEACRATFPELVAEEDTDEAMQVELPVFRNAEEPPTDIGHIHSLYAALKQTERWAWLRRCMEAQVSRPQTEPEQRLTLFEELAELISERLEDYSGSRDALVHCWQLSEDPRYLREIVLLALAHEERDDALRFQRRHFEELHDRRREPEVVLQQRVRSGTSLAGLLLESGEADDLDSALEVLEELVHSHQGVEGLDEARRMLARAHARAGNPTRTVELFSDVLHFQVRADELDDWRLLVDVYRRQLGDAQGAYTRQWALVRAFPNSQKDLDLLIDLAAEADELHDCVQQLATLAHAVSDGGKRALLARAAEAADEELGHAEEAFRLFERVLDLTAEDDDQRVYFERRRAVCLARMAGREGRALEAFRGLVDRDPFEPATYRGMEILFERVGALDRLRVTRQTLRALGCTAEESGSPGKVRATRAFPEGVVETNLIPDDLAGALPVLRAAMPLVEKAWSEALPQRKAFDGRRVKSSAETPFFDELEASLLAFGIPRFRLILGESGPDHPVIFSESTPTVWISQLLLDGLSAAQVRFLAGYCAAMAWSDLSGLTALDGRQVWHLLEGVLYRQKGEGFSNRIDPASQEMADLVSSPFDGGARRRVVKAMEETEFDFAGCHCEAWGRMVERFAARAGLLLCGDLEAAAATCLKLDGWSLPLEEDATQRRLRHDSTVSDLVRLAHSEEYLELRYKVGLAGRPSKLKV